MPAERFDFRNAEGQTLAALLDRPDTEISAVALFAHCFTCGKHNRAARHIADGLKQRGIAALRISFHRSLKIDFVKSFLFFIASNSIVSSLFIFPILHIHPFLISSKFVL